MNDAQKSKYESLCFRMTSEKFFLHVESLQTSGVYDGMRTLLENLGLLHFFEQKCVSMINLHWSF